MDEELNNLIPDKKELLAKRKYPDFLKKLGKKLVEASAKNEKSIAIDYYRDFETDDKNSDYADKLYNYFRTYREVFEEKLFDEETTNKIIKGLLDKGYRVFKEIVENHTVISIDQWNITDGKIVIVIEGDEMDDDDNFEEIT